MVYTKEFARQPVNQYQLHPSVPTTEFLHLIERAHFAYLGALNIAQALALEIVAKKINPNSKQGKNFLMSRMEEVYSAIEASLAMQFAFYTYPLITTSRVDVVQQLNDQVNSSVQSISLVHFNHLVLEAVHEAIKQQETQQQSQVIMIAGHQASGKGVASSFLSNMGFTPVVMSQNVRETTLAWGLNKSETMDKIIAGQVLKEYFGPDILVRLGIFQSRLNGSNQLVIDGPRVLDEAVAVQRMGGIVIGVVANTDPDTDRNIRRQRIVQRAKSDGSRANDVHNFDNREAIEGPKIAEILRVATTTTIINNSTQEDFVIALQTYLNEVKKFI